MPASDRTRMRTPTRCARVHSVPLRKEKQKCALCVGVESAVCVRAQPMDRRPAQFLTGLLRTASGRSCARRGARQSTRARRTGGLACPRFGQGAGGHRVQREDDLLFLASLLLAGAVARVALAVHRGRHRARLKPRHEHHVGVRALRHIGARLRPVEPPPAAAASAHGSILKADPPAQRGLLRQSSSERDPYREGLLRESSSEIDLL